MGEEVRVRDAVLKAEEGIDTTEIARIINDINILSQQLWGIDLFRPRLIQLTRIVPQCENDSLMFDIYCACLGSFIDSLDVKSLKSKIPDEKIKDKFTENNCHLITDEILADRLKKIFSLTDDVKFFKWRPLYSIDYLEIFLNDNLTKSEDLIKKIRLFRRLRNMVSVVHEVDWQKAEETFNAIDIEFPIQDYEEAWNKIIRNFIIFLKEFRDKLREQKKSQKEKKINET